jgi:hypothetical protein
VNDRSNVGAIDAHPERVRRHDDVELARGKPIGHA